VEIAKTAADVSHCKENNIPRTHRGRITRDNIYGRIVRPSNLRRTVKMNTNPNRLQSSQYTLEKTVSLSRQPMILSPIAYYNPILAMTYKVCRVYLSLCQRISTPRDLVLFL
jgi:hypothetical protein